MRSPLPFNLIPHCDMALWIVNVRIGPSFRFNIDDTNLLLILLHPCLGIILCLVCGFVFDETTTDWNLLPTGIKASATNVARNMG